MQFRIFTLPLLGGEAQQEEMNAFLRSRRVLRVLEHLTQTDEGTFWTYSVRYVEGSAAPVGAADRSKPDYRQVLDEATFKRFAHLREWRKQVSAEEKMPAYVIFTDEELAGIAKLPELSLQTLQSVPGIGDKKVEKHGAALIALFANAPQE